MAGGERARGGTVFSTKCRVCANGSNGGGARGGDGKKGSPDESASSFRRAVFADMSVLEAGDYCKYTLEESIRHMWEQTGDAKRENRGGNNHE